MARPPRSWRDREEPRPWTAEEDRALLEMTELGIGLHQHVLDAVLPGRSERECIERRFQLRAG